MEDDGSYVLDHTEAIGELLRKHGLENANATQDPIESYCYEDKVEDCELLGESADSGGPSVRTFQSLVGSLLWVARCTRPDIAFAVHKATRQIHQSRLHDLKLAKRIAPYLKGTRILKRRMKPAMISDGELKLESYSDANFAADKSYRKSLTGGIVRLNGMPVRWMAKKQKGVLLFTMEAKFFAASEQVRELLGIREMLCEIGKPPCSRWHCTSTIKHR